MSSKVVTFTALGCIAAAGFGAYWAVRTAPVGQAAAAPATATSTPTLPTEPVAPGLVQPKREPTTTTGVQVRQSVRPDRRPAPGPADARAGAPLTSDGQVESRAADSSEFGGTVPNEPITVTADASATQSDQIAQPTRSTLEEIIVPADAVLGIRIDTAVSSDTSRVEDRVVGHLTRSVSVDGRTVIPAGTEIVGEVTLIERGGRFKERARLSVRFTAMTFDDRSRVSIATEPIYREGEAPAGEATAKIGASAVIGSIVGGMLGGKRGAAIGSAAGAAGGTAAVMSGSPKPATLGAGSTITVRLVEPVTFSIERR